MSYTQTNTFTDGNIIEADPLRSEFKLMRDHINGLIVGDDIINNTIDTVHIIRPDPIYNNSISSNGAVSTWRWTSGLTHNFTTLYDKANAVYFTNHTKNASFSSRYDYQDMSDCGVQLYVESTARVFVNVYCHVVAALNGVQTTSQSADSEEWYLYVNGTRQDETLCYTSYNGVGAGVGGTPDKTDSNVGDRFVPLRFIYSGTLAQGTYNFQVKGNPRNEYVVCRLRNFFVEIIY